MSETDPKSNTHDPRKAALRELAMFAPNFAKLVFRLYRDPRVRTRTKLGLALLAAYLASPIDLIPDFIPVIGYADDVVLIALSFGWLLRSAGEDLVREHWDGEVDPIQVMKRTRTVVGQALPWLGKRWR